MKKNSYVWLVFMLLCIATIGKAQVVTLENGFAISSLRIKGLGQIMDKTFPYQMSVGMQYLDKGWFNLSSNVGYIRRGERDKNIDNYEWIYGESRIAGSNLYFLTLNTTFDLKTVSRDGYTCFIGVGPRIDFNLKSTDIYCSGNDDYQYHKAKGYNSVLFGLKCVAGIRKDLGNMQIGLNFAYLPSFTHVAPIIRDRTFTFGLTLGYRFGGENDKADKTETIRSVRRHK